MSRTLGFGQLTMERVVRDENNNQSSGSLVFRIRRIPSKTKDDSGIKCSSPSSDEASPSRKFVENSNFLKMRTPASNLSSEDPSAESSVSECTTPESPQSEVERASECQPSGDVTVQNGDELTFKCDSPEIVPMKNNVSLSRPSECKSPVQSKVEVSSESNSPGVLTMQTDSEDDVFFGCNSPKELIIDLDEGLSMEYDTHESLLTQSNVEEPKNTYSHGELTVQNEDEVASECRLIRNLTIQSNSEVCNEYKSPGELIIQCEDKVEECVSSENVLIPRNTGVYSSFSSPGELIGQSEVTVKECNSPEDEPIQKTSGVYNSFNLPGELIIQCGDKVEECNSPEDAPIQRITGVFNSFNSPGELIIQCRDKVEECNSPEDAPIQRITGVFNSFSSPGELITQCGNKVEEGNSPEDAPIQRNSGVFNSFNSPGELVTQRGDKFEECNSPEDAPIPRNSGVFNSFNSPGELITQCGDTTAECNSFKNASIQRNTEESKEFNSPGELTIQNEVGVVNECNSPKKVIILSNPAVCSEYPNSLRQTTKQSEEDETIGYNWLKSFPAQIKTETPNSSEEWTMQSAAEVRDQCTSPEELTMQSEDAVARECSMQIKGEESSDLNDRTDAQNNHAEPMDANSNTTNFENGELSRKRKRRNIKIEPKTYEFRRSSPRLLLLKLQKEGEQDQQDSQSKRVSRAVREILPAPMDNAESLAMASNQVSGAVPKTASLPTSADSLSLTPLETPKKKRGRKPLPPEMKKSYMRRGRPSKLDFLLNDSSSTEPADTGTNKMENAKFQPPANTVLTLVPKQLFDSEYFKSEMRRFRLASLLQQPSSVSQSNIPHQVQYLPDQQLPPVPCPDQPPFIPHSQQAYFPNPQLLPVPSLLNVPSVRQPQQESSVPYSQQVLSVPRPPQIPSVPLTQQFSIPNPQKVPNARIQLKFPKNFAIPAMQRSPPADKFTKRPTVIYFKKSLNGNPENNQTTELNTLNAPSKFTDYKFLATVQQDLLFLSNKYHTLEDRVVKRCYEITSCDVTIADSVLSEVLSRNPTFLNENNSASDAESCANFTELPEELSDLSGSLLVQDVEDTLCRTLIFESLKILFCEEAVLQ